MFNIGIGVVKRCVEIQKVKLVGHRECIGTRIQVNLKWINFERNIITEKTFVFSAKIQSSSDFAKVAVVTLQRLRDFKMTRRKVGVANDGNRAETGRDQKLKKKKGLLVNFLDCIEFLKYHEIFEFLDKKNEFLTHCHSVWKSLKKSHSTLRAKRATFTFCVAKSSLKMPKLKTSGATFLVIFNHCSSEGLSLWRDKNGNQSESFKFLP